MTPVKASALLINALPIVLPQSQDSPILGTVQTSPHVGQSSGPQAFFSPPGGVGIKLGGKVAWTSN
uniref:Uncharacterized protein n=1 Tax=Romanomermis culicivorax TaxID=13658 RepID=A0A915I488_ROMCU